MATRDKVRAWPGGTGSAKIGANYSPCVVPQIDAAKHGYHQNLWYLFPSSCVWVVGFLDKKIISLKLGRWIYLLHGQMRKEKGNWLRHLWTVQFSTVSLVIQYCTSHENDLHQKAGKLRNERSPCLKFDKRLRKVDRWKFSAREQLQLRGRGYTSTITTRKRSRSTGWTHESMDRRNSIRRRTK